MLYLLISSLLVTATASTKNASVLYTHILSSTHTHCPVCMRCVSVCPYKHTHIAIRESLSLSLGESLPLYRRIKKVYTHAQTH